VAAHVLLVEDSSTMRSFIAAALEEEGALQVTAVPSGFEALRVLPQHRFDLIITDVHMPDINGLELVQFVRKSEAHAQTPVIIISTEGSERDIQRGLELGANEYLPKPFEPEALLELVRRHLTLKAPEGGDV
jgi:two-component system chemotaxis response regulator CheY